MVSHSGIERRFTQSKNWQQWGILDNQQGAGSSKIAEKSKRFESDEVKKVPAKIRASSRGETKGASVSQKD